MQCQNGSVTQGIATEGIETEHVAIIGLLTE